MVRPLAPLLTFCLGAVRSFSLMFFNSFIKPLMLCTAITTTSEKTNKKASANTPPTGETAKINFNTPFVITFYHLINGLL